MPRHLCLSEGRAPLRVAWIVFFLLGRFLRIASSRDGRGLHPGLNSCDPCRGAVPLRGLRCRLSMAVWQVARSSVPKPAPCISGLGPVYRVFAMSGRWSLVASHSKPIECSGLPGLKIETRGTPKVVVGLASSDPGHPP